MLESVTLFAFLMVALLLAVAWRLQSSMDRRAHDDAVTMFSDWKARHDR